MDVSVFAQEFKMPKPKTRKETPKQQPRLLPTLLWNALLGDVGADQFYTGATALGLLHVALVLAGVALLSSSVRGVEASVLAAAEGGDSYLDVASKSRAYAVAGWTLLLLNSAWAAADGLTLAWSGCRVVGGRNCPAGPQGVSNAARSFFVAVNVLKIGLVGYRGYQLYSSLLE